MDDYVKVVTQFAVRDMVARAMQPLPEPFASMARELHEREIAEEDYYLSTGY